MKAIKNLMVVLLGLGIIFIGGEQLALQGEAASVISGVSNTRIGVVDDRILDLEISRPADSEVPESEADASSNSGEESVDSNASEYVEDAGANSSSIDFSSTERDSEEGKENLDGNGDTGTSETDLSVQSIDEQSSAISSSIVSSEDDSNGSSLGDSSLANSSMEEPAETGDKFPLGAAGLMICLGTAVGMLMTLGKKEE